MTIDSEDWVFAFHPRKRDAPYAVAETGEELDQRVGEYVGAEQCDNCGNSVYRLERHRGSDVYASYYYVAVCAVDPDDDSEMRHPDPCGTEWPIGSYPASEVVF